MARGHLKEQLAAFHTENENAWLRDRRRAVPARLQDKTQTTLKAALTIKPGAYRNSVTHEEHVVIGKELAGLSDAERLALFESIFPKLALAMDRAWRDLPRRAAYIEQNVYYSPRVPFRAGSATHHLAVLRGAWFDDVVSALIGYEPDLEWLAAWITHLPWREDQVASVLAGAIDLGGKVGDTVLEILKASATSTHPIGEMSFAVIQSLLISARPEAWDFVATLFLNGSRQEGLRQAILESIHECHPDAFVRVLHLIMEERFVRFSSVVRAADVWFGLRWDSIGPAPIQKQIERAYLYLTDNGARDKALKSGSGEEAYMALWCVAFRDLGRAATESMALMKDKDPERRFAAVTLARMARAREFLPVYVAALADPDDRVVAGAVRGLEQVGFSVPDSLKSEAIFDGLARVFDRAAAAKPKKLEPIIWPWTAETLSTRFIGEPLTRFVPKSRVEEMIPRIAQLAPHERKQIAADIGKIEAFELMIERAKGGKKPRPLTAEAHATLLIILGDAAAETRKVAFRALSLHPITPAERDRIEDLLSRKASDLRTSGIARLLSQSDADGLASAARLLGSPNVDQQLAGAEILAQMAGAKRSVDRIAAGATEAAEALARATKNKPDPRVVALLDTARKANVVVPTLRDCLGLVPPDRVLISPDAVPKPRTFEPLVMTREVVELHVSLEQLMEANRDLPISGANDPEDPDQDMVLCGILPYQLWTLDPEVGLHNRWISYRAADGSLQLGEMQHADLWLGWWNAQAKPHGDRAAHVLLLAWLTGVFTDGGGWTSRAKWLRGIKPILPSPATKAPLALARHIVEWLMFQIVDFKCVGLLLDQAENAIAADQILTIMPGDESEKRHSGPRSTAIDLSFEEWARYVAKLIPALPFTEASAARRRLYGLYRMIDSGWPDYYNRVVRKPLEKKRAADAAEEGHSWSSHPAGNMPRPNLVEFVAAANAGDADVIDFYRLAIQEHEGEEWRDHNMDRWSLGPHLSGRHRCQLVIDCMKSIRARVAEIEITRGDAPTAATAVVKELELFEGASTALRALAALKQRSLRRGYLYGKDRSTSLCRLIVYSLPTSEDTDASFTQLATQLDILDDRLIELALYAPQWAGHVERHLKWTGLEDASWWVHAHAKNNDEHMWSANEVRAFWRSRIAERTVVDREDFKDGAVDRAWFLRAYKALGEKRWNQVYALAKAAASGANHKRAQTFADAILGRTKATDLKKAIASKRTQDAIRALGLVPLPSGDKGRAELKDRYLVMQEVRRTSRKHGGSMLQASEKRAVEIGMDNLARTAGYADPQRLQWAMEIEATSDLGDGPVTRTAADVAVTLTIDESGAAEITCIKKGKALASVPAVAKKAPEIAELLARAREIKKQKSRVRLSLESAMCRGDTFTGAELSELCNHPVLRPMLERLVLIQEGAGAIGYPMARASKLRDESGASSKLTPAAHFRIAHPHDMLATDNWSTWQRECFASERIQPFKQLFRELYVPTPKEQAAATASTRYAGHQVQPRQAIALLGSRGWVVRPEEGVQRAFHHERIRASLEFAEHFYTPAEVEGLTVQSASFFPMGKHQPIRLADVPPRVFSEVMRDIDLAVSVAHRGGVDPETTESSIEARASLARETCTLLQLSNVKINRAHAIIKGERGEYSVHLGSGVIHMLPGGSIEVVAVGAQHRGRLFLPFADDDPKTAEILSKVILFARDGEIRDPFILEQIRG